MSGQFQGGFIDRGYSRRRRRRKKSHQIDVRIGNRSSNKIKRYKKPGGYKRYSRRRKNKKPLILFLSILFLCFLAAGVGLFIFSYLTRVYTHCMAEAGTKVAASDFLRDTSKKAEFVGNSNNIDTSIPGDYKVKIKSGIFTYNCILTIEDTVAPEAEITEVYIETGQTVEPKRFVVKVEDATEVEITFEKEPDYSTFGRQPINIRITDKGGNTKVYETFLTIGKIANDITLEIGSPVPVIENFIMTEYTEASIVTPMETVNMSVIGDYNIEIVVDGISYNSVLHVVDTVPPEVEVKDVEAWAGAQLDAQVFVASSNDATELKFEFINEPDYSFIGTQSVGIRVTDAGGNSVEKTANLTLKEDKEPPVISGVQDIEVYLGNAVSYKNGVTVSDNSGEDIELTVDNSQVNLNAVGTYPVTYTAKDKSGNETSQTVNLTVKEVQTFSMEEVNNLCDQVLADIVSDGMSSRDKLSAIYNWVNNNVVYINTSDKSDWKTAAYEGLSNNKGDCFVFASVSKALLTRVGISNRDIQKIPSNNRHYWNLVDIGEGWYHFDACPRDGDPSLCYITTDELLAYSNANGRTHNYDQSAYPDVN